MKTAWNQDQRRNWTPQSHCTYAHPFQQLRGFSQTLLAKGTSENPGMPSPSSTHGGSKGLALQGLGASPGQLCPQHKDMCAFLQEGKKKFSNSLHKRSWSKDVVFRDVTLKNGIPAMSLLSHVHSPAGPAACFPAYSPSVPGWGGC